MTYLTHDSFLSLYYSFLLFFNFPDRIIESRVPRNGKDLTRSARNKRSELKSTMRVEDALGSPRFPLITLHNKQTRGDPTRAGSSRRSERIR